MFRHNINLHTAFLNFFTCLPNHEYAWLNFQAVLLSPMITAYRLEKTSVIQFAYAW